MAHIQQVKQPNLNDHYLRKAELRRIAFQCFKMRDQYIQERDLKLETKVLISFFFPTTLRTEQSWASHTTSTGLDYYICKVVIIVLLILNCLTGFFMWYVENIYKMSGNGNYRTIFCFVHLKKHCTIRSKYVSLNCLCNYCVKRKK